MRGVGSTAVNLTNSKFNPMKYLRLIAIILPLIVFSAHARQKEVLSKLDKVTVFSKGAQIERKAMVQLAPGEQQILISNLPKNLEEGTITVKPKRSVIRSITYRIDYLKKEDDRAKEQQQLYDQISLYEEAIADAKVKLEIIDEEVGFIKSNRNITGKIKQTGLEEIRDVNEYYADRIAVLYSDRRNIRKGISEKELQVRNMRRQVNFKKNEVGQKAGELLITIKSDDYLNEALVIGYFIEDAAWFPSYDFRVKDVSRPMQVVYKANVTQQTGENWKDVDVVISSANPRESSRAPEMEVWRIDHFGTPPFERPETEIQEKTGEVSGKVSSATDGTGLPGVNVLVKGTTIGTVTDMNGYYSIQVPDDQTVLEFSFVGMQSQSRAIGKRKIINVVLEEDVQQLEEVVVTAYGSQRSRNYSAAIAKLQGKVPGVNIRGYSSVKPTLTVNSNITAKSGQVDFEFAIKGKQTIPSGTNKKSLDMLTYEVDADYQYVCSPRYNKNAFLFAHIADWEDLNLLSGEVNLFYEGVFKGKTLLDANSAADTLKISMGSDRLIKVEVEEVSIEKENNILSKRKKTYQWRINVRNLKNQDVRLLVKDQIPVSKNKLIEVDLQEKSSGEYDEKEGYVSWELDLKPSEKTSRLLTYEIKYSNKVNFYD